MVGEDAGTVIGFDTENAQIHCEHPTQHTTNGPYTFLRRKRKR